DPATVSALFGSLDHELWLITAAAGDRRGGLIATFVTPASIVPEMPRVLPGLARQHFTHELVQSSGAFPMHPLPETQLDWVWRFALQSGRDADKLAGLDSRPAATGSPILTAAPAWLDCRVEARLDTGDRTIYLAEVLDGARTDPQPVLTVHRLLALA